MSQSRRRVPTKKGSARQNKLDGAELLCHPLLHHGALMPLFSLHVCFEVGHHGVVQDPNVPEPLPLLIKKFILQ